MSLVGTSWTSRSTGHPIRIVSDEGNWVGAKDDESDNVHYLNTGFLRRRYERVETDMINHPPHYYDNGSGVECIDVAEQMPFVLGNALKYIWRYENKNGSEDLSKARWYLNRGLANGSASHMPVKARQLLGTVVNHEPPGLRKDLFTHFGLGELHSALRLIDNYLKGV